MYLSNTARIQQDLGWSPEVSPEAGIRRLADWVRANQTAIAAIVPRVAAGASIPAVTP